MANFHADFMKFCEEIGQKIHKKSELVNTVLKGFFILSDRQCILNTLGIINEYWSGLNISLEFK